MLLQAEHCAYRDLVANYCTEIEIASNSPQEKLSTVRDALVALYAASLHMPELRCREFGETPDRLSFEHYTSVRKRIGTYTQNDSFWICFHPFVTPAEQPVCSSLSDGLADIWRNLKPGLLALAEDEERWADVVFWDWKFGFETHWGDHAVDSLWAIHKLTTRNE